MAASEYERALGMHRPISRRDFINGIAIGAGASLAGFPMAAGALPRGEFQGQTDQNFAVMHALRDKSFWETAGIPEASGEHYDLIVVGAGISGLAAAFLFQQQAGAGSRILILDNSEDFGGHARRNEFTAANGRRIFGYGGSESFQSPGFFSPAVSKFIADAGIDLAKFGEPLAKLGIAGFTVPGGWFDECRIDYPVSIGSYRFADRPDEPVLLHLVKTVLGEKGQSAREQSRAGRHALTTLTFAEMEFQIRALLARALGSGGFDPAHDIAAIAINRWSHGYAYEYMRPWDSYWPAGPLPIESSRRGWGKIAIANSDAGAYAYAHSAIDQAVRAVRELVGIPSNAPTCASFPGPPLDKIGLK